MDLIKYRDFGLGIGKPVNLTGFYCVLKMNIIIPKMIPCTLLGECGCPSHRQISNTKCERTFESMCSNVEVDSVKSHGEHKSQFLEWVDTKSNRDVSGMAENSQMPRMKSV